MESGGYLHLLFVDYFIIITKYLINPGAIESEELGSWLF
jgi:hypothetical protein